MKYTFQVNLNFGNSISACSLDENIHVIYANNLPNLIKKIKKEHNIKLEQIILTFQPEDK
jgi:hypothetical protein